MDIRKMIEMAGAWQEREEAKRDRTKIADVRAKEIAAKAFGRPIDHFYHWGPEQWAKAKHLCERRLLRQKANAIREA